MKNSTFTLEEITRLEGMTKEELIASYKEYSSYMDNNLMLLTNITTLDKAIYVGIMLKMGMKAKEVCEKTSLTKSHISRLGKVGKWSLNHKPQYQKLVDTAGTSLSVRAIADAITHDTISGVNDWASLVEAEKAYKESTKATPTPATKLASDRSSATPTPATKLASDRSSATPTPATKLASDRSSATPTPATKHAFKIIDFERMNSTSMYSAVIRLCDAYTASGEKVDYMEAFITRLNELKH